MMDLKVIKFLNNDYTSQILANLFLTYSFFKPHDSHVQVTVK